MEEVKIMMFTIKNMYFTANATNQKQL